MNTALSAIAAREEDSRFMPPPPAAFHDHGHGLVQEVPLVSREFLLKCGTTALYLVLQELDVAARISAQTKEELVELIIATTRGGEPDASLRLPPLLPPRPVTAREKRCLRKFKQQVRQARKAANHAHGPN